MPPIGWAERGLRHRIEDEGLDLADRPELNFQGQGVTVTNAVGETRVNIPGGLATLPNHDHTGDPLDGGALAAYAASVHAHTLVDHAHAGIAGDGNLFPLVNLDSGAALTGQVPTADGAGGIDWETPFVTGTHNHDERYYTDAEVDALIAAISTPDVGSFLIEGGNAVWETGLQFRVSAARYYIDSVLHSSIEQTITLDAADTTHPRIDVIALDNAGLVQKIPGIPAASPSRPDVDPSTQLHVTFVLIPANATEPEDVTTLLLYAENAGTPAEWAATDSGATIDVNSTSNPRSGTKDIEATNTVNNDWFRLTAAAALDISGYTYLVLNIRSKATWASQKSLRLSFRNGTTVRGNYISIDDGLYGFESSITGAYQQIAIPISAFAITPGVLVDNLNVETRGGGAAIGFYVDDVSFQGGFAQNFVGITIEEADARYRKLTDDITEIAVLIDGGGSAITTGDKIDIEIGFNCTILSWTLVGKTAGAIQLDIWRCTYAAYNDSTHPVDGDSICSGHEPTIAATGVKAQDLDLSDWTSVVLVQGDILRINVDSIIDMTRCTLNLRVRKN